VSYSRVSGHTFVNNHEFTKARGSCGPFARKMFTHVGIAIAMAMRLLETIRDAKDRIGTNEIIER